MEFVGLWCFASELAHESRLCGVFVPDGEITHPQVVAIVGRQFLETDAGDVGELDLGFFRGLRGFAAFEDVLLTRTRRLDHLIDSAVAPVEVLVGKAIRKVVSDLGFLEGEESLVVAARREDAFGARRIIPMLLMFPIIPMAGIVTHGIDPGDSPAFLSMLQAGCPSASAPRCFGGRGRAVRLGRRARVRVCPTTL